MSYSANHKKQKQTKYYLKREFFNDNYREIKNYKRNLSKKDESRFNISKLNYNDIQQNFSNSSINTNISNLNQREKDFSLNSFPIEPIMEDDLEKSFIPKRKILYKPPIIINNKVISFQKQKDKQILEFSLFDDKLIFKDINRSYLQDEHSDDGSESSEEKINVGRSFLTKEIEESAKKFHKNLKKSQLQKLLSRKMRFKDEKNNN